jgi:hypothetical protein
VDAPLVAVAAVGFLVVLTQEIVLLGAEALDRAARGLGVPVRAELDCDGVALFEDVRER